MIVAPSRNDPLIGLARAARRRLAVARGLKFAGGPTSGAGERRHLCLRRHDNASSLPDQLTGATRWMGLGGCKATTTAPRRWWPMARSMSENRGTTSVLERDLPELLATNTFEDYCPVRRNSDGQIFIRTTTILGDRGTPARGEIARQDVSRGGAERGGGQTRLKGTGDDRRIRPFHCSRSCLLRKRPCSTRVSALSA